MSLKNEDTFSNIPVTVFVMVNRMFSEVRTLV